VGAWSGVKAAEKAKQKEGMESQSVRIHVVNDAEVIKERLAQWGQSHFLDTKEAIFGPISEGLVTFAVRNLEKAIKGQTVVASLLLYRSARGPGIHVEMVYAWCDTALQRQMASRAIQDIVRKVKSSIHLPVEFLVSRARN
jgi:hypothetical protein